MSHVNAFLPFKSEYKHVCILTLVGNFGNEPIVLPFRSIEKEGKKLPVHGRNSVTTTFDAVQSLCFVNFDDLKLKKAPQSTRRVGDKETLGSLHRRASVSQQEES